MGIMPTPMLMATMIRLKRLFWNSTPPRIRMPVAQTMPNITMPAPPRTKEGTEATITASLGRRPSSMRITPPATQT